MKIFKIIIYILTALFSVGFVFNHYDPWAGIIVAAAFIAISINFLKSKTK